MKQHRSPEELEKDLEGAKILELEDGDLEDVAGGALSPEPNENCNNTQCCGAKE